MNNILKFWVLLPVIALTTYTSKLSGCTAIYVKNGRQLLVGNNEDGCNPETKIWTIPSQNGKYGRLYFGFSDLSCQGGINEMGLWFDAFGLPYETVKTARGEIYPGDLQDMLMQKCADVDEVIKMFNRYSRQGVTRYQWMFGDKKGNCAIIEGDSIIRMDGNYQVITNFRQSHFPGGKGYDCNRYQIANEMLKTNAEASVDNVRKILSAVHSEGQDVTLYSYIADLANGLVYVYHFHDFENVLVLDLKKELSEKAHVYDLPSLFPANHAAESFYYQARKAFTELTQSRFDSTFNLSLLPEYCGEYIISEPDVLAKQKISLSTGDNHLNLRLNDGGPYYVIPQKSGGFAMLGYGGLDFTLTFGRDEKNSVSGFRMENSVLKIKACKISLIK